MYELTRLIPRGMVTTYGHLARLAGYPSHSRLVGQALKFLGPSIVAAEEANGGGGPDAGAGVPGEAGEVPWFRVLSASGAISDRGDGGAGATRQAERLRQGECVALRSSAQRGASHDLTAVLLFVRGSRGEREWDTDKVPGQSGPLWLV